MMSSRRGYRNRNSGSAKNGYYTISPNHSMYCMEKNTDDMKMTIYSNLDKIQKTAFLQENVPC